MPPAPRNALDVVVLGGGLAGTVTALCLARQGRSVAIVDAGTHPRFTIGESTTTPSSLWLRVLAERFDVPELLHLASHEALCRNVGNSSGVKNNFGFHYHDDGAPEPTRSWQAVIAGAALGETDLHTHPRGGEMHYLRQDVDAYLWRCALRRGVHGRLGVRVEAVELRDDGVRVRTADGGELRARFVVDAGGHGSHLAAALGLRDATPRWRTDSRTLFTHMVDVPAYDRCWRGRESISPWHQGTLHHFFDGGWIWVIPFDNHPASDSDLCSVGLNLDNHRARRTAHSPEDEWRDVLARFPAIAEHLGGAEPVRPWTAAARVQYSSTRCVGDRYWLAPHAVGAVDALFSMGNINTFQAVAAAVPAILGALRDDDFRRARFEGVERLTEHLLRFQDRIVYGTYAALRSPELLQTWITLWALTDTARIREVLIPLVRHARTGRAEELAFYDARPEQVFTGLGHCTGVASTEAMLDRLDGWCDRMACMQRGERTPAETAAALRADLHGVPPFHVDLDLMAEALGVLPWSYAPLAQKGLRGYAATFLTGEELNGLGVDAPRGDGGAAGAP